MILLDRRTTRTRRPSSGKAHQYARGNERRKIFVTRIILLVSAFAVISCAEIYDFEQEDIDVETIQQPLSNLSAQLMGVER